MLYTKFPIIFLTTIASEPSASTNRHIAQVILEHLDELSDIGIVELAHLCNVGTGSISRFCKEIGLHGFSELKELLLKEKAQNTSQTYNSWTAETYSQAVGDSIQLALTSLNQKQIDKLIQDIHHYDKVYAAGLLKANNAAIDLQTDLFTYGKQIDVNMTFKEQMEHILEAHSDELLILFSYTGSYFDYERFGEMKQNLYRPKIWLITGNTSHVPDYVDEVLSFSSLQDYISHPFQLEAIASYIAQLYRQSLNL